MVIQCESCQTVFNLDESLIKKTGTKVRCSRCRHEFRVFPDKGTAQEAKPQPAEPALEASASPETNTVADTSEKASDSHEKGKDDFLYELQTDLDSIYEEVFKDSETENAPVDATDLPFDTLEPTDEMKNVLEETSKGEEQLASRPAATFPPIDTLDEPRKPRKREKTKREKKPKKEVSKGKKAKPAPQKPAKKSSRGTLIFLIIILVLLGGGYLVWSSGLVPSSILSLIQGPEKEKPADTGAKLMKFGSVNGVFVNSGKNGPLFVIRGMVTNKYAKPRSHILIKGTILDSKGGIVTAQNAYAGNTFSEDELKTLPLKEIKNASKNQNGMHGQNVGVLSGASIPFMIVFAELPDNLSEFTVEAVRSSAGSK